MNILIVSYESWRNTNNGGNVLSNVFSALPEAHIAQIYCSPEYPQNSICKKYFQISDAMLLSKNKGNRLDERNYSAEANAKSEALENKIKGKIPAIFKEASLLARELLWVVFNWRTKELDDFILDFKPDVIFAPCYYYFHVSKLALYVKHVAKCPLISYISDDNYSLKQFRLSPSFWINRLITRKWIRRLFLEASFVYTMTEVQKKEYEELLGRPMKVLCKSAEFEEHKKRIGDPIQLIYAGGLYLNRWKVLRALTDAVTEANRLETRIQLHIYTGSKLGKRITQKLNDGQNVFLHPQVNYEVLMEKYRDSDVAIHVESFDLKNRLITRLSFSTKIIDCLSSGCAVLAVGPEMQAGIAYLKDHDAAICVTELKKLRFAIQALIDCPDLIKNYSQKANKLGILNHQKQKIEKEIRQDFYEVVAADFK